MDNSDPSIPTEWLRVDYSGTLFLGSIATVRVQNYQDSSEQYRIVGAKLYLGCIDDDDEYPTTPFGAQSSSNDYFAGTFGAATSTYNFTPNLECESECTGGRGCNVAEQSCVICPLNTYGLGGSVLPCRSCEYGTTTSTQSNSISQCICLVGYFTDSNSCVKCPSGSTTATTGSTSIAACVCDISFYFNDVSNTCVSCGSGTTSSIGSTLLHQCICNVGFYSGDSTCTACPVGHSTLLKGSFSLSDCHIQIDNSGDAIAAAFLAANPGDHVILAPGQITSGDGIDVYSRFSFANKNVDFTCSSTTIDSCVWIGDQPARVAKILWASGITTYSFLTFKSGFTIYDGGGLSIDYSDVNLVTIKFQSNFVLSVSTGGAVNVNVGNVNFYGCFFNNNRKSNGSGDTDIHRDAGTVTIFGCPAGFINSVTQDGGEDVLLSNTVSDGGSALSGVSYSCVNVCSTAGHSTGIGEATCVACEEGKFQLAVGYPCQVCQGGRYNEDGGGSTSCDLCPVARYISDDGENAEGHNEVEDCLTCGAGKYSNALGTIACPNCSVGKISGAGVTSCTSCERGKYNEVPGVSTCVNCGAGKYLGTVGSPSQYDCASCPSGKYFGSVGATVCTNCATGKYAR